MSPNIALLCLAAALTVVPATTLAASTPVMTFEEFPEGATNVDSFYGSGLTWLNEEVFNSAGTPAQSPFPGPNPLQENVLTRGVCGVVACELELLSTAFIESISLSGLISSGPNLEIRAFSTLGQVGGSLVVDTELQSVGCAVPTDWSCDRTFSFTQAEAVRRLQFVTSGTAVIDNVQVTTFDGTGGGGGTSVPEPATLALAGLALVGIVWNRRRQREL